MLINENDEQQSSIAIDEFKYPIRKPFTKSIFIPDT